MIDQDSIQLTADESGNKELRNYMILQDFNILLWEQPDSYLFYSIRFKKSKKFSVLIKWQHQIILKERPG